MILEPGAKVLLSHRRLFDSDHPRFFVGVVEGYEDGIVKVCGHTWLRDGYSGTFKKKADDRTKIVSITSGAVMVYQLPGTTNLNSIRFSTENGELSIRDDGDFRMDMNESPALPSSQAGARRATEKHPA